MTRSVPATGYGRWKSPAAAGGAMAVVLLWLARNTGSTDEFVATLLADITTWEVGPFVALAFVAAIWRLVTGVKGTAGRRAVNGEPPKPSWQHGRSAAFCCCTAIGMVIAAGAGWKVRGLPPVFHDEYAYRFQAETLLAGRLAFPKLPDDIAACVDQPHILTTPVFASRYFPGTAVWFAAFVAMGIPYAANWLAAGLTAGFMASVGWQWSPRIGWWTGILVAAAPATVAFANLQLSPMPTMLAFSVFLGAYFRVFDNTPTQAGVLKRSRVPAVTAGVAIAAAFLTRPLTAVGLGLPFAGHAIMRLLKPAGPGDRRSVIVLIAAFAIGPILLAMYNAKLTGNPLHSPYDVYMQTRTPSHQYGFFNRTRGLAQRTSTVFVAYDDWTDDLTPAMAPGLVAARWTGLLIWSLGLIPATALSILALLKLPQEDTRTRLIALACLGLTLAYAPYWFVGLLGFSYLAEATPLLLLLLAKAAVEEDRLAGRRVGGIWQAAMGLAILLNLAIQTPKLFESGSEIVAPRLNAAELALLEQQMLASVNGRRVLLLMDADPSKELHTTFVHNRPDLDAQVVRAWNLKERRAAILRRFPDRVVFLIRPGRDGRPPTVSLLN